MLITNCSNNYGPYQFPEKLIPHMILNALRGEPLPVYGDGRQVRDWLYVDDHARALWTVLTRGKPARPTTSAATTSNATSTSCAQICRILEQCGVVAPGRAMASSLDHVRHRSAGPRSRYAIDASKIERDLGWRPPRRSRRGLEKTVHWYLENRQWWQRVLDGSYRLERIGDGAALHDAARNHPGRRLRHAASSRHARRVQAAAADLRQADDLLPAVDADARGHPRRARDLDAAGHGRFEQILGDGASGA